MSKINESGHAKNVANFFQLIVICTNLGAKFNPANANLSLANINSIHQSSNDAIKALDTARGSYIQAIKNRKSMFDLLNPLATRIMNALRPLNLNKGVIENLKTINRKVQGRRKYVPKTNNNNNTDQNPDEVTANTENETQNDKEINKISTSQMSYDNRLANFQKMIEMLNADPQYKPNETELTIAALNDYLTQLQNANIAVIIESNNYIKNRNNRNQIIYLQDNNLYDTAMILKAYLQSVLGNNSEDYKKARKLKFSKNK